MTGLPYGCAEHVKKIYDPASRRSGLDDIDVSAASSSRLLGRPVAANRRRCG